MKAPGLLIWMLCSSASLAATYTVTTATDSLSSPTVGSLRWALTSANTNADADTILFAIPGGERQRIVMTEAGFSITQPVRIVGESQAGLGGIGDRLASHKARPIELRGTPPLTTCLNVTAVGAKISGLAINGFQTPVSLGGSFNTLEDCFLGTTADGRYSANSGVANGGIGVFVLGFTNQVFDNVISGITGHGISIVGTGHRIAGNLIGLDASGETAIGNAGIGILVDFADHITIGGRNEYDGNIIAASGSHGIQIGATGSIFGAKSNVIQGNLIGATEQYVAAGNNGHGIFENYIFGQGGDKFLDNFIVANRGHGVFLGGNSGPHQSVLARNQIGSVYNRKLGNWGDGISARSGSSGHSISNNVIENNAGNGIQFADATGGTILSNFVNANGGAGIYINQMSLVVSVLLSRNRVNDNGGPGVAVRGSATVSLAFDTMDHNGGLGFDIGGTNRQYVVRGYLDQFENALTFTNSTCGGNGPTTNEVAGQLTPVRLTSATVTNSQVTIKGWLNQPLFAFETYRVDFYRNYVCDPSGSGEGRDYVYSTNVTWSSIAATNFTASFTTPIAADGLRPGQFISALVTRANGITSEFCPCLQMTGLGNRVPQPQNDAATTPEDTAVVIPVLANDTDPDGQALQIVAVDDIHIGDVVVNPNGTITYTPATNIFGKKSFAYKVSDGNGGEAWALVTVTILGDAFDIPIGKTDFDLAFPSESSSIPLDKLFAEPDFQRLSNPMVTMPPTGGTAVITTNPLAVSYTPMAKFSGLDTFTVRVTDDTGSNATTTVAFVVQNPNAQGADLEIAQTMTQDTSAVGAQINYGVLVRNKGPNTATGVELFDKLPPGTTLNSYSNSQGTVTMQQRMLINHVGTLASGATAALGVKVTADTFGAIGNEAGAFAIQPDPQLSNNRSTTAAQVFRDIPILSKLIMTPVSNGTLQLNWPVTDPELILKWAETLDGFGSGARTSLAIPQTSGNSNSLSVTPVLGRLFYKTELPKPNLVPLITPQIVDD